jgi:hypothetical protein
MRTFPVVLALVLIASPVGARANHKQNNFKKSDTVLVPGPSSGVSAGSAAGSGVTETLAACDPGSELQGLDGYWIRLPSGAPGHSVTLADDQVTADYDARFYTSGCAAIEYDGMQQRVGVGVEETESGKVPSGSAWVIVYPLFGTLSEFTFTVYRVI